ncbi:hypothetical protein FGIG_11954 [Fasciola gigantica]|uniref:BAR domain-containing protein n=1 Tax=Fasciola gigantica TaxID=46835 RepID=A0A504YR06_FASGI|nr:hypothetical protein FGIG_11954 [Fasciola gigantica]
MKFGIPYWLALYINGDKLEKLLSDHKSFQLNLPMKYPTECLGDVLLSASVDIGKKYAYGQALKKFGEYHRTLAVIENERNQTVERRFLLILFHFMQCDWVGLQVTENLEKLRVEFESQLTETRKKLEGIKMVHQTLLAALKEFVEAECRYFEACLTQAQAAADFIGQLPDGP